MKKILSRLLFYACKAFVFCIVSVLVVWLLHSCSITARAASPEDVAAMIPYTVDEADALIERWEEYMNDPSSVPYRFYSPVSLQAAFAAATDDPTRLTIVNDAYAFSAYLAGLRYVSMASDPLTSSVNVNSLKDVSIIAGWYYYNGEPHNSAIYQIGQYNGEPVYFPNGGSIPVVSSDLFNISVTCSAVQNQYVYTSNPWPWASSFRINSSTNSSEAVFTSLTSTGNFFNPSGYPSFGWKEFLVAHNKNGTVTIQSGIDILYYVNNDSDVVRTIVGKLDSSSSFLAPSPTAFNSGSSINDFLSSLASDISTTYGDDSLELVLSVLPAENSPVEDPSVDWPSWMYPGTAQLSTEHYEIDYNTSVEEPWIELETEAALPANTLRLIGGGATRMTELLRDTGLFPIFIFCLIFSIVIGFLLF